MNEDDICNIWADVSNIKRQITLIDNKSDNLTNFTSYSINDFDERISNLEKKVDEIYSILLNAKYLNLSNLDN